MSRLTRDISLVTYVVNSYTYGRAILFSSSPPVAATSRPGETAGRYGAKRKMPTHPEGRVGILMKLDQASFSRSAATRLWASQISWGRLSNCSRWV